METVRQLERGFGISLRRAAQGIWVLAALMLFVPLAGAQPGAQQWSGQKTTHVDVRYPIGTSVQVHLRNKHTITGQVEKYAGDGFWIRAEGQGPRKDQKLFYIDIRSIDPHRGGEAARGPHAPRFGIDFSVAGADASVRIYHPKSSDDGGDSH